MYPDCWAQEKKESSDEVIYALSRTYPSHEAQTLFRVNDADAQAERNSHESVSQASNRLCGATLHRRRLPPRTTPRESLTTLKYSSSRFRHAADFSLSERRDEAAEENVVRNWRDRQLGAVRWLLHCNGQFQRSVWPFVSNGWRCRATVRPLLPDFRLCPSMGWGDRKVEVFLDKVCEF